MSIAGINIVHSVRMIYFSGFLYAVVHTLCILYSRLTKTKHIKILTSILVFVVIGSIVVATFSSGDFVMIFLPVASDHNTSTAKIVPGKYLNRMNLGFFASHFMLY